VCDVHVQDVPCTDDWAFIDSKIEGVVSRWVEVVDIVDLSCHHAMRVDVIASEAPVISMMDVSPS
jgi:hypothetical protein